MALSLTDIIMNKKSYLIAGLLAASCMQASALTPPPSEAADTTSVTLVPPANDTCNINVSGSLSTSISTAYTGRGYVPSTAVAMGEGAGMTVLKLDFTNDSNWSLHSTIAYTYIMSGHTLYGGGKYASYIPGVGGTDLPELNIENEFIVATELRYTFNDKFNLGFGHDFVHGGMLGIMAKHFADQGASVVNEFFLKPTYSPYKWVDIAVAARYSTQGVRGWWFEPSVTFKAPVIGTPEDMKVAALLSFNMSATGDYFQDYHGACANGSQAWWIKLSTPWFITEEKDLILTPSVSFNWLGKGAIRANKHSEYAMGTGDPSDKPFRNFAVVGSVMLTYKF